MTETLRGLYTIPPGIPFVDALADGLLKQSDGSPEMLSTFRVLLPTRRACRNLREAFLRLSNGKPLLLPRMQPLGDIDEDELSLTLSGYENIPDFFELPPGLPPLKRQVLLARLIMKARDLHHNPDQAFALAHELGRFIDQIYIENLDMADLQNLVPDSLSEHWQITLDFLKILSENWPAILAENGVIDAADRRNRLLRILTKHWQKHPPQTPVIAAGSTGSIPATAALLKTIATLPQGCVILPGLDNAMDQESWDALEPTHPQATMKDLLKRLETERKNVAPWPHKKQDEQNEMRLWLTREMMRPADTVDQWKDLQLNEQDRDRLNRSLNNIQRYDCDTVQEEANLIACLMRETLEHDARTAALITPDRRLARRVAMACRRWDITVDDSAGQALSDTAVGSFIRLTAQTVLSGLKPATLLSLLKHRHFCFEKNRRLIEDFEISVLRGPMPAKGFEGLRTTLAKNEKIDGPTRQMIASFINRLDDALSPLMALMEDTHKQNFATLLDAHITLVESLSETTGGVLWQGEDGEQAALFLAELKDQAPLFPPMTSHNYLTVISRLMAGIAVRPAYGSHPRLFILGQLEARLTQADLLIMAGLNEGTWPPEAPADPWMSRPMRKEFKLPAPERTIGQTAHDFVQGFCAQNVVMTRSRRVDGTPAVPARWLQRLDTVLQAAGFDPQDLQKHPYLHYARMLDETDDFCPVERPQPRPPVEKRPRELYVTAIEKWMRDPYSIYARYVLGLRKLDNVEEDSDAATRGTLIHETLQEFITANPDTTPENAADILCNIAKEKLGERLETDPSWTYWWPRFERLANWFADHEKQWRQDTRPQTIKTEISGKVALPGPAGSFVLGAKADRIDQRTDGTAAIIDYKTGTVPGKKAVIAGLSPQMPLEGSILKAGGFAGLGSVKTIGYLGFWQLTGASDPGLPQPLKIDDLNQLCADAREGLEQLIALFDDPDTPYYSLPHFDRAPPAQWQDYAHLARVQEWAALDEGEDASG
ncbi:MAG: double-strand break repair protein AddB [Rhodospirillales bacterium]|nr:double-strand break repair protein AddB [Rhodospirillales bacterium]